MPRSRKRPGAPLPSAATSIRVAELAWAGRHEAAIEQATAALEGTGLDVAGRLDLLDLRSESFLAEGDLDRAAADAAEMLELARTSRKAAFKAQALNRQALVQM